MRVKKHPRDIRKGNLVAFIAGSKTFEVTFTRKLRGAWAGWYKIQYKQPEVPGGIAEQTVRASEELEVES